MILHGGHYHIGGHNHAAATAAGGTATARSGAIALAGASGAGSNHLVIASGHIAGAVVHNFGAVGGDICTAGALGRFKVCNRTLTRHSGLGSRGSDLLDLGAFFGLDSGIRTSHTHSVDSAIDGDNSLGSSCVHCLHIGTALDGNRCAGSASLHIHGLHSGLLAHNNLGTCASHIHGGHISAGQGNSALRSVGIDFIEVTGEHHIVAERIHIYSLLRVVFHTHSTGGLIDRNAAHCGIASQCDSACTAAANQQTTGNGHILQHDIAFGRAVADDQITGNGGAFQSAGLVQDRIAVGIHIQPAVGKIGLDQVVHHLSKLSTSDAAQGIQHIIGALHIAGSHHGSHGVLGPIGHLGPIGVAAQHALIAAAQGEQTGQNGESFLTSDICIGVEVHAIALECPHQHGRSHGIIEPIASIHIPERGNIGLAIGAESTGHNGSHLRPGQILARGDFPVDAVEQSIVDGVLQRLSGPVVGHIREGSGVICGKSRFWQHRRQHGGAEGQRQHLLFHRCLPLL